MSFLVAPANLVAVSGTAAVYSPNFISGAPGISGLAYAAYLFDLPGYTDSPLLTFAWNTAPADYADAWIGVGNQQLDYWEWFSLPASNQLDFGALAPYLSSDQLVLAVVLTGTAPAELQEITIGDDAIPQAGLVAEPFSGTAPLQVDLDATGSADSDGSIVRYEFDVDGDGTFETDNGASAILGHTYATPGNYFPMVRVTDDKGGTDTDPTNVSVAANGWFHTVGEDDTDALLTVAADAGGNIYAAGYTTDVALGRKYLLLTKWGQDGSYVWGKTWLLGGGQCAATDLTVDSNGDVIVAGWWNNFNPFDMDYDGMLLKWTPDGDLTWARRYNGNADDIFDSVCTDGNNIYVSSTSESFGPDADILFMRILPDGSIDWCRRYDSQFGDNVRDSGLLSSGSIPVACYILDEAQSDLPSATYPAFTAYQLNGDFIQDGYSPDSIDCYPYAMAVDFNASNGHVELYLACSEDLGPRNLMLLGVDSAYNTMFASQWSGPQDIAPSSIILNGGQLAVAGSLGSDAALWSAAAADGTVSAAEGLDTSGAGSSLYSLASLNGGVVSCGYDGSNAGTWQVLAGTQTAATRTWTSASGQSTEETITLLDPDTGDQVIDWSSPELDVDAGGNEGLIIYRSVP